ncbi:hypothetical protein MATL_G00003040 [Megalops atlanticus]|uniref:Uncharacterized protein n=1 Tax=Megalops atlanticus TaxID=7932 RepID=A0A9D3TKQ7_MEGAT|nr:hypothetical protein MATL_G00003040 [Megalops atlanticus]
MKGEPEKRLVITGMGSTCSSDGGKCNACKENCSGDCECQCHHQRRSAHYCMCGHDYNYDGDCDGNRGSNCDGNHDSNCDCNSRNIHTQSLVPPGNGTAPAVRNGRVRGAVLRLRTGGVVVLLSTKRHRHDTTLANHTHRVF